MKNIEEIEIKISRMLKSAELSKRELTLIVDILKTEDPGNLEEALLALSLGDKYLEQSMPIVDQVELAKNIILKLKEVESWKIS